MTDDHQVIIQALIAERDELKQHCQRLQGVAEKIGFPPGHFYSPLVDVSNPHAIHAVNDRLLSPLPKGIHIDPARMEAMLQRLSAHYHAFPFPRRQDTAFRFYFDNPFFACHDACILFSMLLEFRPRSVIEIGSGFSSRLLLDANERFFNNQINLTLIDPLLPELAPALGELPSNTSLLPIPVQEAPVELFERLSEGDILLVDSSHVSKTGSDVNHYLFEILPRLRRGVLIHIHDILYPFEYPADWVLNDRRGWNEAYLIRAFLQYNSRFEILYWNNFVFHRLSDTLLNLMPLCADNEGGSLWLQIP